MKKVFLVALAAVFALSSCVKETSGNDNQNVQEPAKLTLKFAINDEASASKAATGSHDGDQGKTLENMIIFVLNGSEEITHSFYYEKASTNNWQDIELSVNTAASKIVGIGNVGNLIAAGQPLSNANMSPYNLTTLRTKVGDLSAMNGSTLVWMTGTSPVFTWSKSGNDNVASTTLILSVIPARIDLTITDNREKLDHADAHIIREVFVIYSGSKTHYVADATGKLVPTTTAVDENYYYAGVTSYNWSGKLGQQGGKDQLATLAALQEGWPDYDNVVAGDSHKKTFYVFPGGRGDEGAAPAYSKPVKIMIVTHKKSDATDAGRTYWPVVFDESDKPAQHVQNGRWYKLNVKFSGDATTGGGDGEEPIVGGVLTVDVDFAGWIEVDEIDKEFN